MVDVLKLRMNVAGILLGMLMILFASRAGALPAYRDAVKSAYAFKPGGAIETQGCNLCHAGATNRNSLNLYGKDIQTALKNPNVMKVLLTANNLSKYI